MSPSGNRESRQLYQFSRTFHHAVDILELDRERNDAASSAAETFAPKEQKKMHLRRVIICVVRVA